MSRPLVLYHGGGCADGFASAFAAWLHFENSADYVPVQYGQPPPDVTGRSVYILDFSYRKPVLMGMVAKAQSITLLDHHESAQKDFDEWADLTIGRVDAGAHKVGLVRKEVRPGELWVAFDMKKSGGRLAWELFHPDKPVPWLIDLVEDRDLWLWKQPYSREINAWLSCLEKDFEVWSQVAKDLEKPYQTETYMIGDQQMGGDHILDGINEAAVEQGTAILRYQQQAIDRICENAYPMEWHDGVQSYSILVANTPILISEVAGRLAEGKPFGATYQDRSETQRIWSLRSTKEGVDVSVVAGRMGGGGHPRAAGLLQELMR